MCKRTEVSSRVRPLIFFLFSVTVYLLFVLTSVQAKPDINLGSKDSNDNGGTGEVGTYWKTGDYGVRFTVVKRKTGERIARSIDYFKLNDFKSSAIWHTGGNNKLEYIYLKNKSFERDNKQPYYSKGIGYAFWRPKKDDLWNVISTRSTNKTSLKDIKRKYLSSDTFLKKIAKDMGGGMTLDKIKSKENTLMFEPIYYFHMDGKYYALTATEIGLYDIKAIAEGKKTLRVYHTTFSHKAIPVSAFLKKDRYNISRYKGRAKLFTNKELVLQMGIGMVSGKGGEKKIKPKLRVPDYTYRVDTDVYTSVLATAGNDATPDNPIRVEFDIPGVGKLNSGDVYVPKGMTQLVWVKWHTPKEPAEMNIKATIRHSGYNITKDIYVDIEKKVLWEPLNPKADDTKPINLTDFDMEYRPSDSEITNSVKQEKQSWSIWETTYQPNGDFIGWDGVTITDGKGNPIGVNYYPKYDNDPYYSFGKHEYGTSYAPDGSSVTHIVDGRTPTEPKKFSVKLDDSVMDVRPARTANRANPDERYVKSGYGIEADISVKVSGSGIGNCTGFQSARYFFPEFNYKKYWRWGERIEIKTGFQELREKLILPKNNYSYTGYKGTSDGRFHFLPIWYPDGIYDVYAEINDCWTPAGEIRSNLTGEINCKGALWDDWHIQPGR